MFGLKKGQGYPCPFFKILEGQKNFFELRTEIGWDHLSEHKNTFKSKFWWKFPKLWQFKVWKIWTLTDSHGQSMTSIGEEISYLSSIDNPLSSGINFKMIRHPIFFNFENLPAMVATLSKWLVGRVVREIGQQTEGRRFDSGWRDVQFFL